MLVVIVGNVSALCYSIFVTFLNFSDTQGHDCQRVMLAGSAFKRWQSKLKSSAYKENTELAIETSLCFIVHVTNCSSSWICRSRLISVPIHVLCFSAEACKLISVVTTTYMTAHKGHRFWRACGFLHRGSTSKLYFITE